MIGSFPTITPRLILGHLQRWRRARRLGVDFLRRGSFRLPSRLRLNGKTIDLDLLDEHGTNADFIEIFLNDMYMIESIRNIQSVLDVGANQGLFSIYARHLYPGARIHAYEPNSGLEGRLRRNCSLLDIDVFMEGVAATDGACNLQPMGDSNQTRIVTTETGGIPVTSLSQVLERIGGAVDLMKLDCEGFEWDILTDQQSLRRVRWLTMEYHLWANGSHHDQIGPWLERLGFDVIAQTRSTDFGQVLARRVGVTHVH